MSTADRDREFETFLAGVLESDRLAEVGALRKLRKVAKRTVRAAARPARSLAKAHPVRLAVRPVKTVVRATGRALAAARRRIFRAFFGKLVSRRARKIAYSQRRSLTPNQAEQREATVWAGRYLRRKGLFGKLVATALVSGEPASSSLVTASIPLLLSLARRALKTAEREGAPADPRDAADRDPDGDATDEA